MKIFIFQPINILPSYKIDQLACGQFFPPTKSPGVSVVDMVGHIQDIFGVHGLTLLTPPSPH